MKEEKEKDKKEVVDKKDVATTDVQEDESLKEKSTEELEHELDVLLCMSNSGGTLADEILAELATRDDYMENADKEDGKTGKKKKPIKKQDKKSDKVRKSMDELISVLKN